MRINKRASHKSKKWRQLKQYDLLLVWGRLHKIFSLKNSHLILFFKTGQNLKNKIGYIKTLPLG